MPVRLLVSRCSDQNSADEELRLDRPAGEEFEFETTIDALSALPPAGIDSILQPNGGGAFVFDRDHDRIAIQMRHPDPNNPTKLLPFQTAYLYGCDESTTASLKALLPKARERSKEDSIIFQRDLEDIRAEQAEIEDERQLRACANLFKMETPRRKEKFSGRDSLGMAYRSLLG